MFVHVSTVNTVSWLKIKEDTENYNNFSWAKERIVCGVIIMTFKSSQNLYRLERCTHQKLLKVHLLFLEIYSSLSLFLHGLALPKTNKQAWKWWWLLSLKHTGLKIAILIWCAKGHERRVNFQENELNFLQFLMCYSLSNISLDCFWKSQWKHHRYSFHSRAQLNFL